MKLHVGHILQQPFKKIILNKCDEKKKIYF